MRIVGSLVLLILFALPIYWGANQYCKTQSKVQLYGIIYGGQLLLCLLLLLVLVAMGSNLAEPKPSEPTTTPLS